MSIFISSVLSIIHPELRSVQIYNFNSSYALFKSNLWFVTVIALVLICIVSISYLLIVLFHLFKGIIATKLYLKYLKPLFSVNKSLNKLLILLFPKNSESFKLILSTTSTS